VEDFPEGLRQDRALYSSCVAGAIGEQEYLDGLRAAGLGDVEVLERVVYSGDFLEEFVKSELPANERSCCGGATSRARALEGKVASVRVAARKP